MQDGWEREKKTRRNSGCLPSFGEISSFNGMRLQRAVCFACLLQESGVACYSLCSHIRGGKLLAACLPGNGAGISGTSRVAVVNFIRRFCSSPEQARPLFVCFFTRAMVRAAVSQVLHSLMCLPSEAVCRFAALLSLSLPTAQRASRAVSSGRPPVNDVGRQCLMLGFP